MDAPKKARVLDRNRSGDRSQSQRGERQIVLPMTREQFDHSWHDAERMRQVVDHAMANHPELFPACFRQGYGFHGFARTSVAVGVVRGALLDSDSDLRTQRHVLAAAGD